MSKTTCTDCDPSACESTSMLLKKIDMMISDNYTLLVVLAILLVIIGLIISYFMDSLISHVKGFLKNKKEQGTTGTDNPRYSADDDITYYDNPKEDPKYEDPVQYMPKGQYQYVKKLDKEYEEYNKLKSQYIATTYDGRTNDDLVDTQVIFKEHDDYDYDNENLMAKEKAKAAAKTST